MLDDFHEEDLANRDALIMEAKFPGHCLCGREYEAGDKILHLTGRGWVAECCTGPL